MTTPSKETPEGQTYFCDVCERNARNIAVDAPHTCGKETPEASEVGKKEILRAISPLYDADADSTTIRLVEEDVANKLDTLTETIIHNVLAEVERVVEEEEVNIGGRKWVDAHILKAELKEIGK